MIVNNFRSNNYVEYESEGERKTLLIEEYLNKIKTYLKDIINDLKKSDSWKIQLTIIINFISYKDNNDEECEMHSKIANLEIMINNETDEVIEELSESLNKRYQNKLEESMKGSEFSLIVLIYCIINDISRFESWWIIYRFS